MEEERIYVSERDGGSSRWVVVGCSCRVDGGVVFGRSDLLICVKEKKLPHEEYRIARCRANLGYAVHLDW